MKGFNHPSFDPKIREAVVNAREAKALFKAIVMAHEVDGDIPETLRLMLADHLYRILQGLEAVVSPGEPPF